MVLPSTHAGASSPVPSAKSISEKLLTSSFCPVYGCSTFGFFLVPLESVLYRTEERCPSGNCRKCPHASSLSYKSTLKIYHYSKDWIFSGLIVG